MSVPRAVWCDVHNNCPLSDWTSHSQRTGTEGPMLISIQFVSSGKSKTFIRTGACDEGCTL